MEFYVILAFLSSLFIVITAAPLPNNLFDDIGEYGHYFEGDMVLTQAQYQAIDEAKVQEGEGPHRRNGLIKGTFRWPNKTVVYEIEGDHSFDEEEVNLFEQALEDISKHSCIKFRKRESADEHAVVLEGMQTGCFSSVGYHGHNESERQVLNLASKCFKHGTIVHEMLHTLGFYHMQSTYDRDDFVEIVWENIKRGTEHNFARYNNDTVTDFGIPYDYGSVMHYGSKAFSVNGNNTIIPKKEGVTIGQRKGLSESDILKLNKMYECEEEKKEKTVIDLNFFNFVNKT